MSSIVSAWLSIDPMITGVKTNLPPTTKHWSEDGHQQGLLGF